MWENVKTFKNRVKTRKNLWEYVKTFKKANDFKFLWVKNGNILLRRNEGSKIFNIKKPSDLEEII